MDAIASLDLVEIVPSGKRVPTRIEISQPHPDERGSWACPVLISSISEKVSEIHGEDSLQALCLAVRFVHIVLRTRVERGSRLICDGGDFPLDAYWGYNSPDPTLAAPLDAGHLAEECSRLDPTAERTIAEEASPRETEE